MDAPRSRKHTSQSERSTSTPVPIASTPMVLPGYRETGENTGIYEIIPISVGATGGETIVEAHGAISELTDAALAAVFANADEAQTGDLIYVDGVPYRMQPGATDARLATSWDRDSAPVDDTYSATSTSDAPLAHRAISSKFNALVTVSEDAPNVAEADWEIWVQRPADSSFIEGFLRVTATEFMSIGRIS